MTAVHKALSDFPGGKKGQVLTADFTVCGIPCIGLNGYDYFKQSEAFSFQIAAEDQEETDRYWNAIVNNGGELTHSYSVESGGEVKMTKQEIVEMIERAGFEAVERDTVYNRVEQIAA